MMGNSYLTNISGSNGTLNKLVKSAISVKDKSRKGDIFNKLLLTVYIEWKIVDKPNKNNEDD